MSILSQLQAMGIDPQALPAPGGSYISVNVRGPIAYVAIQFPILKDEYLYLGRLGQELSTEDGYAAAKLGAANVLGQIEKYVGEARILGLNHMDFYYQSSPDWDEAPKAANGASDFFVEVLGEKGKHSRAIFGVEKLPRNFSIGLTCTFTLA